MTMQGGEVLMMSRGTEDDRPGDGRGALVDAKSARSPSRVDLRKTWQVAAGSILIPLGVVLILIAWYGSAHTPYVQQQIPYLVSGSFVGLGCMVLGGLLYWAHWLYRLYDQAGLHHYELMRVQQEILAALIDREHEEPDGIRRSGFVATAGGEVFHLSSCPIALGHPEGLRRLSLDEASRMQPCRICEPLP
jgi:hypothetical protein